jgi:hypothetical protein
MGSVIMPASFLCANDGQHVAPQSPETCSEASTRVHPGRPPERRRYIRSLALAVRLMHPRVCSSGNSMISVSSKPCGRVLQVSLGQYQGKSYDLFLVCDPDSNDFYQRMKSEALRLATCRR